MVQTGSLSQLGANVGKVYAVSTLGSITGVLFPTLVLMPTIGVRKSFVLLSLFIFMCAVLGLERKRFALLILLPVFGFFVIPPHLKILPYQVYSAESMYNFIYVVDDGRRISLLFDEGLYFQSSQYKGRIISGSAHNAFNLMPLLVSGRDALLMGLGGGTVVKQYRAYFNMNVDVVEIDGKVLDVARQYFDLPEKGVNVHIMDARRYLLGAKKRYDVIGMDVFISEQVQEHLTTTEFFELLKKRLKPDGVLGINVVTVSAESSLMRHLYASLKEHFNYVRVFRSGPYNFFVLATDGSNVDELKRRVDGLSDSMLKASLQATLSRPVKVNRATQPAYDDVLYNFDYEQIQIRWNMLRASETCMLYTQSSQPTP
jgi:spermidine synthase